MPKYSCLKLLLILIISLPLLSSAKAVSVTQSKTIVRAMSLQLAKVKSLAYSANFEASDSGATGAKSTFSLDGQNGWYNTDSPTSKISFKIDAFSKDKGTFSTSVDILGVSSTTYYIKINKIDLPNSSAKQYSFNFSGLIGQWIKIDRSSLLQNMSPFISAKVLEENTKSELQKKEMIKDIQKIVSDSKAFRITSNIGPTSIDGVFVNRYTFIVDKAGLKKTIAEINELSKKNGFSVKSSSEINSQIDKGKSPTGEIWLGKDYRPYYVVLRQSDKGASMIATLHLKDYDKPVLVNVPEKSVDFREVIASIFSTLLSSGSVKLSATSSTLLR